MTIFLVIQKKFNKTSEIYTECFDLVKEHDKNDVCSVCHGYLKNYVYNYEEVYINDINVYICI